MKKITKDYLKKEDLKYVYAILFLKLSFESAGHFFRGVIPDIRDDSNQNTQEDKIESLRSNYDAFEAKKNGLKLRKVGLDLFDKILKLSGTYNYSSRDLNRALREASENCVEAGIFIEEFIKNNFSKKLFDLVDDNIDYYLANNFHFSPFYGDIVVSGSIHIQYQSKGDKTQYNDAWKGQLILNFPLNKKAYSIKHSLGAAERKGTKMVLTETIFPGVCRLSARLPTDKGEQEIIFYFPTLIQSPQDANKSKYVAMGMFANTGLESPDFRAIFEVGLVQGDLTLMDEVMRSSYG